MALFKTQLKKRDNSVATPILAPVADPGTRNLGFSILKTKENIILNKEALMDCATYVVLDFGRIDAKDMDHTQPVSDNNVNGRSHNSTSDTFNAKATLSQIGGNLFYHLVENANSNFVKTIKSLQVSNKDTHEWYFYSENQEGISPLERKINPYLADMLMPQCYVNGCLSTIMRGIYNIKNIRHPAKTVKWGNSDVPYIPIPPNATDYQKKSIAQKNKILRKDFFVHYIMHMLEKTGQTAILDRLKEIKSMDDRAHPCDCIAMGMRAMMSDAWLEIETRQNGGIPRKTTNLPPAKLTESELKHVLQMLALNSRTAAFMGLLNPSKEFIPKGALQKDFDTPPQKRNRTRKRKAEVEPSTDDPNTEQEDEVKIVRKVKKQKAQ
jgi:hypothetical protein